MAAETLDQLKFLVRTWRENAKDLHVGAQRMHDDKNEYGAMLAYSSARASEQKAVQLEAALLALGERQETAEPPQEVQELRDALDAAQGRFERAEAQVEVLTGKTHLMGRCGTTLTERFSNPRCTCDTYTENLGPCLTWEEGGRAGFCVYCDHALLCHYQVIVASKGIGDATRSLQGRGEAHAVSGDVSPVASVGRREDEYARAEAVHHLRPLGDLDEAEVINRAAQYFAHGGLWNPEQMSGPATAQLISDLVGLVAQIRTLAAHREGPATAETLKAKKDDDDLSR